MIHQYKMNGYNIVIDVFSGAIHVVDEVAYDIIALYETTAKEQIVAQITEKYKAQGISEGDVLACIEDVEALKEAGQLFAEDIYGDKAGNACLANHSCDFCINRGESYLYINR